MGLSLCAFDQRAHERKRYSLLRITLVKRLVNVLEAHSNKRNGPFRHQETENNKRGSLPPPTVHSNANAKNQCQGHEGSNYDQPICVGSGRRKHEHFHLAWHLARDVTIFFLYTLQCHLKIHFLLCLPFAVKYEKEWGSNILLCSLSELVHTWISQHNCVQWYITVGWNVCVMWEVHRDSYR